MQVQVLLVHIKHTIAIDCDECRLKFLLIYYLIHNNDMAMAKSVKRSVAKKDVTRCGNPFEVWRKRALLA